MDSDCLGKIQVALAEMKTGLSNKSKTCQLWLKYQWMLKDLEAEHPTVYQKFERGFHVIRRSNQFWAGLGSDLVIEQTLMRSLKSTGGLTRGRGMTEQQRAIWTMSSHISSAYNCAMQDFCQLSYTTSEQHKDVSTARIDRDATDIAKVASKLEECSPFSSDGSLRNIVTGVVANDDVNVHNLDTVGRETVENMKGQPVFSYSFRRRNKVKTLASAVAVNVSDEKTIDPALLFQRFLVVSRTGDLSLEEVMCYELCPFPPSLFEMKNILRKADKPQLAGAIRNHLSTISNEAVIETIPETEHYVIDGGSLIHRLKWNEGRTYIDIAKEYASFTARRYGNATVVFDGYGGGPSIKDNTHQRRRRHQQQQLVNITVTTRFAGKREDFLSNDQNKQSVIDLISTQLREAGFHVVNADGDADVDIVKAAVQASTTMSTTVIGEDTDLLMLLLHHKPVDQGEELYFRSDIQSKSQTNVYNIKTMKQILGDELCTHLLFVHAFTGCDSTSRIFGVGKKTVHQKFVKGHPVLTRCAQVFCSSGHDAGVVEESGRQAMISLFNGKSSDSLSSIRYSVLSKKVSTAHSFVTPERLPPTVAATTFHSRRAYYQVMTWMDMSADMDPTDWGWFLHDDKTQLVPIMMKKSPEPESLAV